MKKYVIGLLVGLTIFLSYTSYVASKESWQKIKRGAQQGIDFLKSSFGDSGKKTTVDVMKSRWIPLPDEMPLDQAVFLGTHNSYAHGPVFAYRQHVWTMEQQIDYGARALMLDTHPHKDDVYLCHAECVGTRAFSMTLNADPGYRLFSDALSYIEKWLNKNPDEIMFVFLENYVKGDAIDIPIEQSIKNKELIMTESDWNDYGLYEENQVTIGFLRKNNKRLFIFNEDTTTQWTMNQWNKVVENNFSTIDPSRICGERGSSKKYDHLWRPLLLMNYFKEITSTDYEAQQYHTSAHMRKVIMDCFFSKHPNFIFIDHMQSLAHINKKGEADLLDLINEMNARTMEELEEQARKEVQEGQQKALLKVNPKNLYMIRLLLEQGADPNVIDEQGITPLMRVIMAHNCGRYEADPASSYQQCAKNPGIIKELCKTTELFFKKGAHWDIKDKQKGWTAYDYARFNGMADSYLYPFVLLLRGQPMIDTCAE